MKQVNCEAILFNIFKNNKLFKEIHFGDLRRLRVIAEKQEPRLENGELISLGMYTPDIAWAIEQYPTYFGWLPPDANVIIPATNSEKFYNTSHPEYSPKNDLPFDYEIPKNAQQIILNAISELTPRH